MMRPDTTQVAELACVAVGGSVPHRTRAERLRGRIGRCAAGISTAALGVSVAAMAAAQSAENFILAPLSPEAEEAAAAAAAEGLDNIFGVPVNTIFFAAAALIALFWFTLGGGRKPKVSRNS